MPQPGDPITPSIRLVRELGSGGMGSVWVADHAALQTQVVVKFMHVQLSGDRDSVLRFSREAAAGANVKSPHVVQVLDHGIAPDGAPFIVMELLEGSDLAAHCERNGPMTPVEVDHVISQTCKALARAHERGIVHRDIKPQNIFLTNVGGGELFVKVLDFGIAKASGGQQAITSATKTGALMGTPYYMSPEQTVGAKGLDHRTDLWALGVVAFESLTGRKPFEAETIGGLAVAICSGPMPVPSRVNAALSAEVDRWFSQACARDVAQRFASAKEMADALHLAVTGRTSDQRFSGEVRSSLRASDAPDAPPAVMAALPAEAEPVHGLGLTTRAPVSGDGEDMSFLPSRRGRIALVIGAVALLAGGAVVGLRAVAIQPPAESPAAGARDAPPVVPTPAAPPATSTPVVLAALPGVPPPVASAFDRKAPSPGATALKQGATAVAATPGPKAAAAGKGAPAAAARAPNCDPNYTLDANGEQHFKPECFAR
jgi:serine/threonine-protein kinase